MKLWCVCFNYAMHHLIIFEILICISKFGLFENSFLENVLVWSIGTWSLHTIKLGIIYSGYSWLNFLYSLISSYLSCHYNRTQSINQPIAYIFKNVAILRRLKHINKTLWQEQKKQTMTNFEKKKNACHVRSDWLPISKNWWQMG